MEHFSKGIFCCVEIEEFGVDGEESRIGFCDGCAREIGGVGGVGICGLDFRGERFSFCDENCGEGGG